MYLFSMGRHGSHTKREVNTVFGSMSVVGGFITAAFYGTFYTYLYLTRPFIELKLARAFENIIAESTSTEIEGFDERFARNLR